MKSKILLMIVAATEALLVHGQSPVTFFSNKKIMRQNKTVKVQRLSAVINTNPLVKTITQASSSSIVIDYTNNLVPVEAKDDNFFTFDQPIPLPATGKNKLYDYGNLVFEPENVFTNTLTRPPKPDMLDDRTAFQIPGNAIDFNGLLVDTVYQVYATNTQGLYITKVHFTAARASLESITGVVTDSLIIPEQTVIIPQGSLVQKYPTAFTSKWIQDPGKTGPTVFISLASERLDHAPVQIIHEHNFVHRIVGWGKIRVPTVNGPSNYFDCLLDKVTGPDILTLFVNGKPASKAVSTIFFGNPNFKQTSTINQYHFLKKGFWDLGAEAVFEMDPGFSKVLYAIFDESYLDIDCENGVNMCLEGNTDCFSYANNEANTAMLELGATLGSCDGPIPSVTRLDNTLQSGLHPVSKANLSGTKMEISPNPATAFARVSFSLSQRQTVSMQVFDMKGRLVKSFADAQMEAGTHQLIWNCVDEKGSRVSTGVYFLRLNSGKYSETKMISLVK